MKNEIIEEKDIEKFTYAYTVFTEQIFNFIIAIIISVIFNKIKFIFCFLMNYLCLRSFAGGHHAKQSKTCCLVSASIAGSFHLYSPHYLRGKKIIENSLDKSLYDFGITKLPFSTDFEMFDSVLDKCFELEEQMRRKCTKDVSVEIKKIQDCFLRGCMQMLFIYNSYLEGVDQEVIINLMQDLPESDFRISAIEYFGRKNKNFEEFKLSKKEQLFFEQYSKSM